MGDVDGSDGLTAVKMVKYMAKGMNELRQRLRRFDWTTKRDIFSPTYSLGSDPCIPHISEREFFNFMLIC